MTPFEKRLVLSGVALGFVLALGALGVTRLLSVKNAAGSDAPSTLARQTSDAPEQNHGSQTAHQTAALPNVQLTQEEQAQIGLQTVEVHRHNLDRTLLAVAKVDEPETQLAAISARIGGRVDKLMVDYTGQSVRRGQPIALIYSPEVLTAAEEYRLAFENQKRFGGSAEAQAISGAQELVTASRRRLELWGLSAQQIDDIATSTKPQIELPIYSPASGIVTERKVTAGQYVNAGDVLYTVTDLSTVWVKADLYEPDLPSVRMGQGVEITSDMLPGFKMRGKVSFIDPQVNAQTRTASIRIQVPNPGMRLRPGMFGRAQLAGPVTREALSVPRSAVIDTGTRKLVYVAKGNGEFEGREVQLGPPADELYPVLAGLHEGERVVTQGNFLIDSQTRITGGMTGLFGGSKEFDHGQVAAPPENAVKFSFRSDPANPKAGADAIFHVTLADPSGKPIPDAQVKAALVMPAMPAMNMPEMSSEAGLSWNGFEYVGRMKVSASGSWNVEIQASRDARVIGSYRARLMAQ